MRIWRISNHADLSGRGGELAALRWNHLGRKIVYCSDHPATAMLEILVNVDAEDLPDHFQLLEISVPRSRLIVEVELPVGWKEDKEISRDVFEQFCRDETAPVLRAPSVVMPHTFNFLINPSHPKAQELQIESSVVHPLDRRFLS
ncbi:MAG: RES family NAD+ phosphorylase [Pseudomonadota bacterium]